MIICNDDYNMRITIELHEINRYSYNTPRTQPTLYIEIYLYMLHIMLIYHGQYFVDEPARNVSISVFGRFFFFLLLLFKFFPVFELCVRFFFYYNFSLSLCLSLSRCAMSVRQNNIGVPFGRVQYRVE